MSDQILAGTSRRALIAGAGAVGVAGVLAACGGEEKPGTATSTPTGNTPTTGAPQNSTIAKKSDIPVGSGKIFGEDGVVITQPTAGEFVGLSAICTHQQCVLAKVVGDTISCGCHGSEYSVKDGKVKKGPATRALDKQTLKIEGDDIKLG
ncbi:MAG TPA: Rieske (2Fe-2S) protein [Micromonosporaceae bacterium]|nr:Rieske (2Fe-2S) protein [Micromonosporaceae bacterium]HCU50412.1 Rieske (2Fe-2S) protein [Micromonosporaceae bacterium]